MMLSGDDQIQVNASSSFDFGDHSQHRDDSEPMRCSKEGVLSIPQKLQINES